jgi:hypothetical protein
LQENQLLAVRYHYISSGKSNSLNGLGAKYALAHIFFKKIKDLSGRAN